MAYLGKACFTNLPKLIWWEVKNPHYFSKALIAKGIGRMIKNEGLVAMWCSKNTCTCFRSMNGLESRNIFRSQHDSTMWRANMKAFDVMIPIKITLPIFFLAHSVRDAIANRPQSILQNFMHFAQFETKGMLWVL